MTTKKAPVGFWLVTIFCILWNLMGVLSFFAHTFITDEAIALLPENEQNLYGEYPLWVTVIFAVAVFSGLFGSIGLLLKKKWAKLMFVVSLAAIIPQMIHNVFFTSSIEVYGLVQACLMPTLVVVFGIWFFMFSSSAIKKGRLS